jgi:hypothetical protein
MYAGLAAGVTVNDAAAGGTTVTASVTVCDNGPSVPVKTTL